MLRIKGKLNSLAGVSYIGLISCGSILLLLFTAFILMPSFTENQATATNNDSGISTYSTTTTPSVSISLPDSIVFSEVVPTPNGSTTTASTSFSVATTESDGYSLYLYSEGDGSLKSSNPANISSIIATQGDVGLTLSSLKSNTWGYNLGTTAPDDNTTYIGVSTDSTTPIQTKDTSSEGQANDTYTLSFGAKVDSSIPSGAYSNILTMAVIAEPQSIVEELPDGINPDTYTSTNPGVVDVYPTTGWGGNVIAITSDGQFSEVTAVATIGGTSCTPYQVVNEYLIACKLPTKAASTNDGYEVAVTTSTGDIDMHNFTVRYFDPTSTTSMQSFTEATCGSMSIGDVVSLVDERNGQIYRVRKMENNTCWMIDSMKYLGEEIAISNVDGTSGIIYNNTSGYRNTVNGTSTQSSANFDKAFYNNPMGQEYCYSDDASSSYTKCGYLYNWYAATAGSGTYNLGTDGTNATASICPAGWELPTMEDFNNLTYLDIVDWQTTGKWSGMLSGYWNTSGAFAQLSTNGYYWSSTAYSSYNARDFYYKTNSVVPTDNTSKIAGFAVRCSIGESNGLVTINFDGNGATGGGMGQQIIAPGATKQLTPNDFERVNYVFDSWNTSADGSGTSYSNGATLTTTTAQAGQTVTLYAQWKEYVVINDVYPTTGWAGNTIQIILNRIPSAGIDSITIGGTACAAINVSGNTVSCTLPSKAASSDNGYAVEIISANSAYVADNHNFTVRYFNPSRTITVGSTNTSHRTMQTFTSANCSSMTVGQTVSLTDTRNGQTYRVRKMADNKCWMIDNMKYLGEEMTINNEDDTSGIFLNDTDGNYNTSDGEIISDAKAIYNNPMTQSYCYDEALSSSYTKCGYLYNFYAVAAGTTSSRRVPPEITICPVGWRLPTGGEDNTSDYAVLNASMANGNYTYPGSYAQSYDSKYYAGFQFDGAWSGVLSGYWSSSFSSVGVQGGYWASGQPLIFRGAYVMPSSTSNPSGDYGYAVRCVMP